MTSDKRRQAILELIQQATSPIPGGALARQFQVSRQIIVQDIAVLKAQNPDICATARGYMMMNTGLYQSQNTIQNSTKTVHVFTKVFCVAHTDEQMEDELQTIVDHGGTVIDVFIDHGVYGSIKADLSIKCRRDVQRFMNEFLKGTSVPLKNLSSQNLHFHTIEAESEETLHEIEQALDQKGYLIKEVS